MTDPKSAKVEPMAAPKRSRPTWLVVLIILVVVGCCCAALAGLTAALWNYGDQWFGLVQQLASGAVA
jgi:hypothetical protein